MTLRRTYSRAGGWDQYDSDHDRVYGSDAEEEDEDPDFSDDDYDDNDDFKEQEEDDPNTEDGRCLYLDGNRMTPLTSRTPAGRSAS